MAGGAEMGGGGTEEIRQAPELSWVSWLELEGRHHHLRPQLDCLHHCCCLHAQSSLQTRVSLVYLLFIMGMSLPL